MNKLQRYIEVLQAAQKEGASVEIKSRYNGGEWVPCLTPGWNFFECHYRVTLPSPTPTTRTITAKDWEGQPVIWVKTISWHEYQVNTIDLEENKIWFYRETNMKLSDMADWKYSFDRKTWHPFTISEPGTPTVISTEGED